MVEAFVIQFEFDSVYTLQPVFVLCLKHACLITVIFIFIFFVYAYTYFLHIIYYCNVNLSLDSIQPTFGNIINSLFF